MSLTKTIRIEEVKRNNNSTSTWVVIQDSVYDVTEYLNEHPGGVDVLLEQAGLDATDAFEEVGHSSDARTIMAKYKIGELHGDDIVKNGPKSSSSDKQYNWNLWLTAAALGFSVIGVCVYKYRLIKSSEP